MLLFRYMRKVTDASRSIEQNFADPDVLGVYQLSKKVAGERMRVLQFMRFQKTADQTYFGIMEPIYNVYPLTIQHFQDRFADQAWIIYDARRRYGYYYDLKEVNEITFENSQADFLRHGKLQDELLDKNEKRLSQIAISFEMAFFVSAKKIGQARTSLSQDLPVSLIFRILGNQAIYPKDNV